MKKWYIDCLLLTLLMALFTACGEKIKPGTTAGEMPVTVQAAVAEARVSHQPIFYEAVGTITARTAATISSKLMGTVEVVHVREGDLVKTGDLLVSLDQRQVSAQLNKAQAALKEARRTEASAISSRDSAQAAADLAASTFERYSKLLEQNSVSQQEFDEIKARHRQAQAGLIQAEAMLAAARHRVQQVEAAVETAAVSKKDAKIRAPYNGRIVAKMIDTGDLASPGTPFFTIEQEGLYCTDLVLPERHIQSIQVGLAVKVIVPALGEKEIQGTVGRIVPSAEARSRSFQIKVAMPQGLDFKSGMFARVMIPIGDAGMLLIPDSAIVEQGQLTGVYILDTDNIARFHLVRIGKSYGSQVEVITGLKDGQRYVTVVPLKLSDGDIVKAAGA